MSKKRSNSRSSSMTAVNSRSNSRSSSMTAVNNRSNSRSSSRNDCISEDSDSEVSETGSDNCTNDHDSSSGGESEI